MREKCIRCNGKGYHIRVVSACRKLKYRKPCLRCGGSGETYWIDNIKGNNNFVVAKNYCYWLINISKEIILIGDNWTDIKSRIYIDPYVKEDKEWLNQHYQKIRQFIDRKKMIMYKQCRPKNSFEQIEPTDKILQS